MRQKFRIALLLLFATLTLSQPGFARKEALDLKTLSLDVGGRTRTSFVHVPKAFHGDAPVPLLIALHGGGNREASEGYARRTRYNDIADREGFIVVYPHGVGGHWNDGRGVEFKNIDGFSKIDDVNFIRVLMDYLLQTYSIDPDQIYVEGTSNGGMMSFRLACEMADRFAGVATVIAAMPENIVESCAPSKQVPTLIMSATADPLIPYEGGVLTTRRQKRGTVISAADTVGFWTAHNGCQAEPELRDLNDRRSEDGSTIRAHFYETCEAGSAVGFYEILEGGHGRPGAKSGMASLITGPANMDISASEEIWAFFQAH